MLSMTFALLATWLPQYVLPDNARYLWFKANYIRRSSEARAKDNQPLRSVAELDRDMRSSFRDLATHSIPLVEGIIEAFEGYVKANENDPDPKMQARVKDYRRCIEKEKVSLRWYQRILEMSDRDPIPWPK